MKRNLNFEFSDEEAKEISDDLFLRINFVYNSLLKHCPLSNNSTSNSIKHQIDTAIINMHRKSISHMFAI